MSIKCCRSTSKFFTKYTGVIMRIMFRFLFFFWAVGLMAFCLSDSPVCPWEESLTAQCEPTKPRRISSWGHEPCFNWIVNVLDVPHMNKRLWDMTHAYLFTTNMERSFLNRRAEFCNRGGLKVILNSGSSINTLISQMLGLMWKSTI